MNRYQNALNDLNDTRNEYRDSLAELNVHKRIIRFIFALLIGGTIWGLVKYRDIIDDRIAEHVVKMDRLPSALSLSYNNQWRAALALLDKVKEDFKTTEFKPSQEFKDAFFLTYLWVLGQIEDTEPDGTWLGQDQWRKLNEDPDYIKFKTLALWLESDQAVNNNLAFCTLKYAKSDILQTARNYFQKSTELSRDVFVVRGFFTVIGGAPRARARREGTFGDDRIRVRESAR